MSVEAAKDFARKAYDLYPSPKWQPATQAAWVTEVIRNGAKYPDEVIERAWQDMLATRKPNRSGYVPTPSVAECIEYFNQAERWINAEQGKLPLGPLPEPSEHGFANSQRALAESELGRRAAREGWHMALLDHVFKDHNKLPTDPKVIERLQRESVEMDRYINEAIRHAHTGDGPGLVGKCAEGMLARREATRKIILGEGQ